MEMKKKIEQLELVLNINRNKIIELEEQVKEQKQLNSKRVEENDSLKEELLLLEQRFKETHNESQQQKDKLSLLKDELEKAEAKIKSISSLKNEEPFKGDSKTSNSNHNLIISNNLVTPEQFACLEEELVLIKEKYAQLQNENGSLNKALVTVKEEYNIICNRNHNQMFMYIAPLVLMVLYLLISSVFS